MPSDSVAPATPAMIQPYGHPQLPHSSGDLQETYLQSQNAEFICPPRHAQPSYPSQDWQEACAQPQRSEPVYPPPPSQGWPEVQAQPQFIGFSGWNGLFTNAAAFEVLAAIPVPSNGKNLLRPMHLRNAHQKSTAPFHGWGDQQGGYPTAALYPVRLQAHSPSHCFP